MSRFFIRNISSAADKFNYLVRSLKSSVWMNAVELLDTDHPYFTFKQGLPDTHELLEFQRI